MKFTRKGADLLLIFPEPTILAAMAQWIKTDARKYEQRGKDNPRKDVQYLTMQQREGHICNTAKEADVFLQRHLQKADVRKEKKES